MTDLKILRNSQSIPTAIKLMVFSCVFIISCTFSLPVCAQSGIQTDTTTSKQDSTVKYLTPWEYAFMMGEETSWLFKIDVPARSGLNQIKVGIEKKIAPSFSLDLKAGFYATNNQYDVNWSDNNSAGFYASLETRWYYRMNKRVREDKLARNMSDNYLAVGLSYSQSLNSSYIYFKPITVFAKWGLQRRFLKYGHIDFGVKAGALFLINRKGSRIFSFSNFVDVGFAFTKDKYELDRKKLCPILKCYDADKFIIKSNLSGLFEISISKSKYIALSPHIAFERKISKSSFSVNLELRSHFSYTLFNYQEVKKNYWLFSSNVLLEGRWYYNLKNRILKGKTGNGLSANYIALGGSLIYSEGTNLYGNKFHNYLHISTGWQRLFSKHLYLDINVGFGYRFETENVNAGHSWPSNIAVGYRF